MHHHQRTQSGVHTMADGALLIGGQFGFGHEANGESPRCWLSPIFWSREDGLGRKRRTGIRDISLSPICPIAGAPAGVSYGEDYNFGWKLAIDNGEGKLAERVFAEFGKISRPTLWRCCNFPIARLMASANSEAASTLCSRYHVNAAKYSCSAAG
jgi:hypothetical protein